jgi:hypothetical protein
MSRLTPRWMSMRCTNDVGPVREGPESLRVEAPPGPATPNRALATREPGSKLAPGT